eukprot:9261350-Pyramimonas_sp.AAC.1
MQPLLPLTVGWVPCANEQVLDAFKISSAREDATGHKDMVHYCPVVYHAIAQVLMHQLCGCEENENGL